MRPVSILWFEWLYALAILIGVMTALVIVSGLKTQLGQAGYGTAAGYAAVALGTLIPLLLLWMIAHRASDPARWVLVALTVLSVAIMLIGLARGTYAFNLVGQLELVQRALTVAAVVMTFRADAKAWLVKPRAAA